MNIICIKSYLEKIIFYWFRKLNFIEYKTRNQNLLLGLKLKNCITLKKSGSEIFISIVLQKITLYCIRLDYTM